MKLDYLKEKKELVSVVLLGLSALMAVLVLIKVAGFFVVSARAGNLVEKAIAQSDTDAKDTEKYFAASRALADGLKKNNLWVPPPPKQHPVKEVPAIFGDEVLINNKWYKVGDTVGDAKIVAIEPTKVEIEWDGSVKAFLPINATIPPPPKGSKTTAKAGSENTGMVVAGTGRAPMGGRDGRRGPGGPGGGGFGGRPGMPGSGGDPREAMRQKFMNMSEAERDKFRNDMRRKMEAINKMPEAQRQKAIGQMREAFGGSGLGGGFGGGVGGGFGGGRGGAIRMK